MLLDAALKAFATMLAIGFVAMIISAIGDPVAAVVIVSFICLTWFWWAINTINDI